MKIVHVEQLINFDALVRTKDLELRAARKIIEENIRKSQKQADDMHNMKIRMQKLQDENMRQKKCPRQGEKAWTKKS
jgi:hypothetical protein